MMLIVPLSKSYQSLPQNLTRPGGELVEMMITQPMIISSRDLRSNTSVPYTPAPPFFFVSDKYTVIQMNATIYNVCGEYHTFTVSAPIALNSTGNIKPENVVQFYRGDSAALLLQGYNNTEELLGHPHMIPNPQFPPGVGLDLVSCIDRTVDKSIPLMDGDGLPARDKGAIAAAVVGFLLLSLCAIGWCCKKKHRRRSSSPSRQTTIPATMPDQINGYELRSVGNSEYEIS